MEGKRRPYCSASGLLTLCLLLACSQANSSEIFQWRDANGRLHFGDTPPVSGEARNLSSDYASATLPFELHIEGVGYSIPPDLRQKIELSISKTFAILRQSLNIDYQDARDFRVVIYGSHQAFRQYQQQVAPILHLASGFYSSNNNQITTYNLGDHRQLLSLLTHEAVHAILQSAQLQIPIWLHEGLASYLENLELHGLSADVPASRHALHLLLRKPLNEAQHRILLSAEQPQWLVLNGADNYAYSVSGSTVFFLMDSSQGRELLRYLLTGHSTAHSNLGLFDQHWPGGFSQFHQQFSQWLQNTHRQLPKHRY